MKGSGAQIKSGVPKFEWFWPPLIINIRSPCLNESLASFMSKGFTSPARLLEQAEKGFDKLSPNGFLFVRQWPQKNGRVSHANWPHSLLRAGERASAPNRPLAFAVSQGEIIGWHGHAPGAGKAGLSSDSVDFRQISQPPLRIALL